MTLADVDRESVEAAMGEFEQVGRGVFLKNAGFGRVRTYFAARGDRLYDSKALIGWAHGLATGTFLRSPDFTGGEQTVAARLPPRL